MTLDARPSDAELMARPHAKGCSCYACGTEERRRMWGAETRQAAVAQWDTSRPTHVSEKQSEHDPKCLCRSCYDAWRADVAAKSKPIILTLPVPPSSNRWHRHVGGRAILSAAARKYTKLVKLASANLTPITGPVQVEIWWHRARKSGDLDKRVSILLDALQGAAYVADSQIEELHAYRIENKDNPHVEVRVTPIPPTPSAT